MGKSPLDLGVVAIWLQSDDSTPHPKTNALAALSICLLAYGAVFVVAFYCNGDWGRYASLLPKHVERITGLERIAVKKKPVDPAWQKLLALFGLWLITIFKILIPTATWAKHFLVLVALIGLFELCLLFTISTLVLLALIGLLATRLYLAFSGEGGLFGLRRTRMVGDQHNDLESQVLNSNEVANKE